MGIKVGHNLVFSVALNLEVTTKSTTIILLWFVKMLQSMIMYVCVRCVFIVTTKYKAMRNNHHEEQDDQETSSLFYIFILYIILFRPSINKISETDDEKKTFTFGKI